MKTKLIIAVLFCASLLTSCSSNNPPGTDAEKNTGDTQGTVQQLLGLLHPDADVVPSVTAAAGGIYLNIDVNMKADIDSLLDRLIQGANISYKTVSVSLNQNGPGAVKLTTKIFFPLKTASASGIFPTASAQESPWPLTVDGRPAVNLFRSKASSQLTAEITGDNNVKFPYNDNDPLVMHITGVKDGSWYEIAFPTNYLGTGEIAREVAAWIKIQNGQIALWNSPTFSSTTAVSSTGPNSIDYVFNGPNSAYYTFSSLTQWYSGHTGWNLPVNGNKKQYYLSVREGPAIQTEKGKAYFNIVQ